MADKKRLEMAYIKLKEEKKKVQEVCLEVGFKNPSKFSTAFKNQYEIPPKEVEIFKTCHILTFEIV
ncbi:helix-turn-helix domain-containing protein [Chitinophagaceae bacterium LY-5]|uniref:Helix-turn-helix domain-containing protein n=1 Tax=Polluticaenibacter yanchengensis TaxID=3014562 RepID=A0ABT4UN72_9BACT|nr:helix-turn-helix domain-containing protein [Chitinophagaceae bacterium LY-5]